jgi:hypothetical protein
VGSETIAAVLRDGFPRSAILEVYWMVIGSRDDFTGRDYVIPTPIRLVQTQESNCG